MKKLLLNILIITLLLTGCTNNKETNNNNLEDITGKEEINKENNEENKDIEEENKDEIINKENIKTNKLGHTLNSTVGKFIIDKDGLVYYEASSTAILLGAEYKITNKDLEQFGKKQRYINYTYQAEPLCDINKEGCIVNGYKLDLENISSAYEIYNGNGGTLVNILFLTYDGIIHELSFKLGEEACTIKLTKNVSKYPNIVSIVPTVSFGGHGTMIIDKNGNKYHYQDAKKK